MENVILCVGLAFASFLICLLFGIVITTTIWYVSYMHKRLGAGLTLITALAAFFILLTSVIGIDLATQEASVNLSKRATPVVSNVNVEKLTSVGNCRYARETTVWLIEGVIVRKQVIEGTYTCVPDNKELAR